MKRDEIYDRLDQSRERMLVILEQLPDEALQTPGVMDGWTIADILDHLTAWESELVTALMRINQGKKPTRLLTAYADVDGYNAKRHEETQGRDLDRIFEDYMGVRVQLEEWLTEFSDRQLNDPNRYPWTEKKALWEIVAENTFGHEEEHLPEIEAFASRWQSPSPSTNSGHGH